MRSILSKEEFARTWNDSDTLQDFLRATGYGYSSATSIAYNLRKKGISVKSFKEGRPGSFAENRELARIAGQKGGKAKRNAR